MKDSSDISSIDFDFSEPLNSYKEENTTSLEDVIKFECIENGCYVGPDKDAILGIADEFSECADRKEYLRDVLLDDDLIPLLCDALAHKRDNEAQGIFDRLKGIATKNVEEEIEAIAARLL